MRKFMFAPLVAATLVAQSLIAPAVWAQEAPGLPAAPQAPAPPDAPGVGAPPAAPAQDFVADPSPLSPSGARYSPPLQPAYPGADSDLGAAAQPDPYGDDFNPGQRDAPTSDVATPDLDPPGRVGRVQIAAGRASIRAAGAQNWSDALGNRPLTTGDALWVDQDGRAQVHLGGIALHVGPRTLLRITALDDHTLQLGLAEGTLHVHLPESPTGATVEVDAPGLAANLLQAGDYLIAAKSSGEESLLVRAGFAEARIGTDHLRVKAGQTLAHRRDRGAVRTLRPAAAADDFESWSLQGNSAEAKAVALRYVSRDTVGFEDLDAHGTWTPTATYGTVWQPRDVAADWAPYRCGHWAYIAPWGWTWVDDAPWGFAPYHYGRWVNWNNSWAWAPGNYVHRPIYAPHLVTFMGAGGLGVGVGVGLSGGAVAWTPLGWGEPFMPGYGSSQVYLRGINGGMGYGYGAAYGGRAPRYVNRGFPGGVTAVPPSAFSQGGYIGSANMRLPRGAVGRAPFGAMAPGVPGPRGFAPPMAAGVPRPPASVVGRPTGGQPFAPIRYGSTGGRSSGPYNYRGPVGYRPMGPMGPSPRPRPFAPMGGRWEPSHPGHGMPPSVGHPAFEGHMVSPSYHGGGGRGFGGAAGPGFGGHGRR